MKALIIHFSLVMILLTSTLTALQQHAVVYDGASATASEKLISLSIAGILNRDSARIYLLNVYPAWSYPQTDLQWKTLYEERAQVQFDQMNSINELINRFRPYLSGAIIYDKDRIWGNFPGQSFNWQAEYAALIGSLTNRIPCTPDQAAAFQLDVQDSLLVVDKFDKDPSRWLPGNMNSPVLSWNDISMTEETRYLTMLHWGIETVLPLCNPSKVYIREITDFAIQHKMFQVNLAGSDDLKLDSMPAVRADILERMLQFLRAKNSSTLFHMYGWIRPEPMVQWFTHFGASFHETLLGNISWHSAFRSDRERLRTPAQHSFDTTALSDRYYIIMIGSEGDASNWNIGFQSGAWLSPFRGSVPVNWGWNLHLLELCPFIAEYYYSTATINDGFISVTTPLGYSFPDLWPSEIDSDAVASSKKLMDKFGINSIYGYKHYEGSGSATYRGKLIDNSFNFTRYGQFQTKIQAQLTIVFDPKLPLQTPSTKYGTLLLNHCDDGSFYGNVSNISTTANRILQALKGKPKPYFLMALYQRFRQEDFGSRPDPSTSDMSLSRVKQVFDLMQFDTTTGKYIQPVTIEEFTHLLRKHLKLTSVESLPDPGSEVSLEQNYPNPYNGFTTVRYSLPYRQSVSLTVYDILGRIVQQTRHNESEGTHIWNINTDSWSSGVYIYQMQTEDGIRQKKMLLLR